jgi:catechol 2,3-dioxygenase-like lactoylglutathione lyase family enzyme
MPGVAHAAVVLLEFAAQQRERIRRPGEYTVRGHWNLNFYVRDIRAVARDLAARGLEFWSEPVGYEVSAASGAPIEVLFEGPDGVVINLVQLAGGADTVIGRVRAAVEQVGYTSTGWSAVATTSHSTADATAAQRFYTESFGLATLMDEILDKPETNHFLRRPAQARTRAVFLAGAHPYGKIALSQNLNYTVPDHVAIARAPHIGYLAQSFTTRDLAATAARALAAGASPFSDPALVDARAQGSECVAQMLRVPASGALVQLVEAPE